jgi:molybdenum cofactor cytidylyltransferase
VENPLQFAIRSEGAVPSVPRVAVVVLALPPAGRGHAMSPGLSPSPDAQQGVFAAALQEALATDLPVKVVTQAPLAEAARRLAAARDVLLLQEGPAPGAVAAPGEAIARGVGACPEAAGWLLLQTDLPLVRSATLLALARALRQHPVVFAQHRGRPARPVGFSAELYSDLIGLHGADSPQRLLARYPAHGVEVDDPGVILQVNPGHDPASARRLRHASPEDSASLR